MWAMVVGGLLAGCVSAAADDDLWKSADARIEKHRKVGASVCVVDAAGKQVPNVTVEIEQTDHAFLFGCNIFAWGRVGNEGDEELYRTRFAEVFNFATLPFYWPMYEPRRGEPQHERTEQIARWCKQNLIVTKGHPLAWNFMDPRWLPDDLDEVRQLQMARIDDCVARFDGLIDCWDVVNEATHFERGAFKNQSPKITAMWERAGRIEFVHECFQHARGANGNATLLINDYRTGAEYEALIGKLVSPQGDPIYDVIGIQSHQHAGTWDNRRTWDVCERYARFGVPLHFTETTITSGDLPRRGTGRASHGATNERRERWQADEVERFYTMLFSHPAVEAITWWDFSDRGAWQGAAAGFLRKDMSPKPAYERLHRLVKHRWWTKTSGQTDSAGELNFRGFRGRYRISVVGPNGQTISRDTRLVRGVPNRLKVTLSGGG